MLIISDESRPALFKIVRIGASNESQKIFAPINSSFIRVFSLLIQLTRSFLAASNDEPPPATIPDLIADFEA